VRELRGFILTCMAFFAAMFHELGRLFLPTLFPLFDAGTRGENFSQF
jgi:hypothetical protein